jgi:hypothetical protein
MAAYLCIASNGVPPSVSKRIVLQVHFPPQAWIPNQLVGGSVGGEAVLECHTEAFPRSINYWTTERGEMITSGDKYEAVLIAERYKVYMRLRISRLDVVDFGSYRCIARNFLGETDGTVKLYDIPTSSTVAPSTTMTHERIVLESKDHMGDEQLLYQGTMRKEIQDDGDTTLPKNSMHKSKDLNEVGELNYPLYKSTRHSPPQSVTDASSQVSGYSSTLITHMLTALLAIATTLQF